MYWISIVSCLNIYLFDSLLETLLGVGAGIMFY